MGSREEFDLTERLIRPGMSDEESAAYWEKYHARVCVIKHGMQGSTAYTADGQKYSISSLSMPARDSAGAMDMRPASCMESIRAGT